MNLRSLDIGKRQEIRSAFKNGETFSFRSYKTTEEYFSSNSSKQNLVFSLSTMIEIARIFQCMMTDLYYNKTIKTNFTANSLTCGDFTWGELYKDGAELNTPASKEELGDDEFMDWADDQIVAVNFEDVFFSYSLPNPHQPASSMGTSGPLEYRLDFGQLAAEEGENLTEKAAALAARLYDAIVTDCKKEST